MRTTLSCALLGAFAASAVHAANAHFVRTPTVGCYDRVLVERATDLREENRGYDFDGLLRAALDAGQCRQLRPGLLVVIEDSDIVAGLSKVRAQGEPAALWVRYRALAED
jgi:hypothetical protein